MDSQRNENVGIQEERAKTKGKGIKKAVPEPNKVDQPSQNKEETQQVC